MADDKYLDLAIYYVLHYGYPPNEDLTTSQKRAVRKRAKNLTVNNGEVFFNSKGKKVSL